MPAVHVHRDMKPSQHWLLQRDHVNLQHTHLLYDENRHFAIENLLKKLILEVITHKKYIPKQRLMFTFLGWDDKIWKCMDILLN